MFRIVIVDDEPLILRNLKNSIQTAAPEFKVVGTATDGMTGLRIIRELKPDVAFVDICMPVMNGLEIIETLRKEDKETGIVILSGYQEFEYAKKAISLGVIDYLVKPLNPLALKDFLQRIAESLSEKMKKERNILLEKILHYHQTVEQETNAFDSDDKFFLTKICFGAFNFFRNNQFAAKTMIDYCMVLEETCKKVFSVDDLYWIIASKYENEKILVVKAEKKFNPEQIINVFDMLSVLLHPENYVTFVISDRPKSLEELPVSLTNLDAILYHHSIFGKSVCFYENQIGTIKENQDVLAGFEEKLKIYKDQKKSEALLQSIKELFENCESQKITQSGLITVLKGVMKICCRQEYEYDIDFLTNAAMIYTCDYKALFEKFIEIILEYSDMEKDENADELGTKYIVFKVQDYLDNHFAEKVLIQDVAEKFGFNYSYLCHLFRKYQNISPNEYIISKRMKKAKELLDKERSWSIKNIAQKVGYADPYYFSRIFKTYTGVSPSDYRKE